MIWISLVSAIFVFLLGIFVLLKNRTSPQNIFFALFCAAIFIWLFGTFMMFRTTDNNKAMFWDRFVYMGVVFIPSLLYHFSLVFTGISHKKIYLKLSYLFSFLFLFLSRTDYFVKGLFRYKWGCHTIAQPLHHIFLVIFWLIFLAATYNIYHFHRICTNQIKKRQASYILFAFILLFVIGAFAYLPAYKIPIYSFPFLGGFLFVLIVAYAIIAHKLLDINIVFRKGLGYSLIIALLFIVSVVSLILLSRVFGQFFPQEKLWSTVISVILLAIIFQPLYRWSNKQIDRWFFKGTLPDISAEKEHIEQELLRSERLAALGIMASGLAHEIKNPLVPIKTYIQNLPQNIQNPEFVRKISTVIPEEVDKITDLLNQLRDFAQPPKLNLSETDLHKLLDGRLFFLEKDFSQRNIRVEKVYQSNLPKIKADHIQLERVFLNLFLNAIDAMPDGGKLTITTKAINRNSIIIRVTDTGVGIDKEDLPHIFDPFYSKSKKKGMGLGLTITYEIIKEHGGIANLISTINKGTSFIIRLPISP